MKAVERIGLDNITAISKKTGVPVESLRYIVWTELPKHGIDFSVSIDLSRIGLGIHMLQAEPELKEFADAVETILKASKVIVELNRIMPTNSLVGFANIPYGQEDLLSGELQKLVQSGILRSFSLERVEWIRSVSINLDYYDFATKSWHIDWDKITATTDSLSIGEQQKFKFQSAMTDYKDLIILSEIQKKIPRTITELSRRTGLEPYNLRYHYIRHAKSAICGYHAQVLNKQKRPGHSSFVFIHGIESYQNFVEARKVALALPFTTSEWKTKKGYCWSVICPGEFSNEVQKFVTEKFAKIPGPLNFLLIDSTNVHVSTLPRGLFDEREGRWREYRITPLAKVISKRN